MIWEKSGAIYDGDWKDDKRFGFGTLSTPAEGGGHRKVYSGGWKNDKRHVSRGFYFQQKNYSYADQDPPLPRTDSGIWGVVGRGAVKLNLCQHCLSSLPLPPFFTFIKT